jgi:hypothetical protein
METFYDAVFFTRIILCDAFFVWNILRLDLFSSEELSGEEFSDEEFYVKNIPTKNVPGGEISCNFFYKR